MNINENDFFPFSNSYPPSLDQAKLESLKDYEFARGYLFNLPRRFKIFCTDYCTVFCDDYLICYKFTTNFKFCQLQLLIGIRGLKISFAVKKNGQSIKNSLLIFRSHSG